MGFSRVETSSESQPSSADFAGWRVSESKNSSWPVCDAAQGGGSEKSVCGTKARDGPYWHLSSSTGFCQAEIFSSQSACRHSAWWLRAGAALPSGPKNLVYLLEWKARGERDDRKGSSSEPQHFGSQHSWYSHL